MLTVLFPKDECHRLASDDRVAAGESTSQNEGYLFGDFKGVQAFTTATPKFSTAKRCLGDAGAIRPHAWNILTHERDRGEVRSIKYLPTSSADCECLTAARRGRCYAIFHGAGCRLSRACSYPQPRSIPSRRPDASSKLSNFVQTQLDQHGYPLH